MLVSGAFLTPIPESEDQPLPEGAPQELEAHWASPRREARPDGEGGKAECRAQRPAAPLRVVVLRIGIREDVLRNHCGRVIAAGVDERGNHLASYDIQYDLAGFLFSA